MTVIIFKYMDIELKEGKETHDFIEALDKLLLEWGEDDNIHFSWHEEDE